MNTILVILAFLFLLAGLLGSVVPVIPGPPLGFAGLLLLQWSGYGGFSSAFLLLWAAIIIAVTIIDYILPALMTKRFGGSRAAVIGSVLGLITGIIFFAPIGLLIGPFLGAFAGELINYHIQTRSSEVNDTNNPADIIGSGYVKALKVAFGALLAFVVGAGIKMVIGSLMIYYAVKAMIY